MASPTWWTWVWACSGTCQWTGKPGCCSPWCWKSLKRLSNWTELRVLNTPTALLYPLNGSFQESNHKREEHFLLNHHNHAIFSSPLVASFLSDVPVHSALLLSKRKAFTAWFWNTDSEVGAENALLQQSSWKNSRFSQAWIIFFSFLTVTSR